MKKHKHTALAALALVFAAPGLMFCGPAETKAEDLAPPAPAPTFTVTVAKPAPPPFYGMLVPATQILPPIEQPTPVQDVVKNPPPPPCPDCPTDMPLTEPPLPDPAP
jgi:hypothetical protein